MGACACSDERKVSSQSKYCFFTYGFVPQYQKTLFRVNRVTLECETVVDNRLNFENLLTVQVDKDLFGYQHMGSPVRLVLFAGLNSGQYAMIKKAPPIIAREFPSSPLNYNDVALFVTGGRNGNDESVPFYKSVDMYDIRSNAWTQVPRMNHERAMHCVCLLGS